MLQSSCISKEAGSIAKMDEKRGRRNSILRLEPTIDGRHCFQTVSLLEASSWDENAILDTRSRCWFGVIRPLHPAPTISRAPLPPIVFSQPGRRGRKLEPPDVSHLALHPFVARTVISIWLQP